MCKFALMDCVENRQQIPAAFKILKKAPDFIWDWYIKKFNPVSVEKIDFDIADGLAIRLPIEKQVGDLKKIDLSVRKTVADFPQIKIVRAMKNYSFDNFEMLKVSHGNFLFAFLSMRAIEKFCALTKKNLSNLEIFILDANSVITQILIDAIYPFVNYLSVITERKDFYLKKQHDIFVDTGLNLQLLSYNKSIITGADIIFNTGLENNFDYAIKRNAIYFDLGSTDSIFNLRIKRPDIFAASNLNLYYNEKLIDLIMLEMIFYCAYNDFRKVFNGIYDSNLFFNICRNIDKANIKISSFQKNLSVN